MRKTTYLEGLLQGKCPRCRQGKIFKYPATHFKKFNVMNEVCPSCGVRMEPEPGFYQGAMYVSYAFTVAFLVIIGTALYLLADPADWVYIVSIIFVMVLLVPWNFRYSRILYLYWFGGLKLK